MPLTIQTIHSELCAAYPEHALLLDESVPCIIVPAAGIKDVCLQLRDHPSYDFDALMCLSGVDYADGKLGVVYHLSSVKNRNKITLKVLVSAEDPRVPSVELVWRTADWHEREAWDLFGIVFDGHRDLRRILLPYDWEGHPLRKNYEVPEFYNGMKVPY